MTQIDILKMAKEAGLVAETSDGRHQIWYPDNLCHFAHLVAAKEREACAKLCENMAMEWEDQPQFARIELATMMDCALAIRARGEQA